MAISHQSLRRARNISQVTLSTRQLDVDTVQSDGEVGEKRDYGAFDQRQLAVQVPKRLHQGSIMHHSASSSPG